jgi:hypothetical protein
MDQAVEAVLVMSAFTVALTVVYFGSASLYASSISAQLAPALDSAASIVASTVMMQNGNSSSSWFSWAPSADPSAYGLPQGTAVYINATCFTIGDNKQLMVAWSKATATAAAGAAGSAHRLIVLDDGTALKLEVRVR